jgi:hypothetical protein
VAREAPPGERDPQLALAARPPRERGPGAEEVGVREHGERQAEAGRERDERLLEPVLPGLDDDERGRPEALRRPREPVHEARLGVRLVLERHVVESGSTRLRARASMVETYSVMRHLDGP